MLSIRRRYHRLILRRPKRMLCLWKCQVILQHGFNRHYLLPIIPRRSCYCIWKSWCRCRLLGSFQLWTLLYERHFLNGSMLSSCWNLSLHGRTWQIEMLVVLPVFLWCLVYTRMYAWGLFNQRVKKSASGKS